jgi:hypothetical protein
MMNIYNGNVLLDPSGEAEINLPAYFEALNREFRYQLTAIGRPGPNLFVAREISDNSFAEQNRIQVEVDKSAEERGSYLHPKPTTGITRIVKYLPGSLMNYRICSFAVILSARAPRYEMGASGRTARKGRPSRPEPLLPSASGKNEAISFEGQVHPEVLYNHCLRGVGGVPNSVWVKDAADLSVVAEPLLKAPIREVNAHGEVALCIDRVDCDASQGKPYPE